MQTLDWFQTIGAGLVIIYSLVWLILHFREVINTVWSSLKSLYIWLGRGPTMIREWIWWEKYQPSWEVISGGSIKVTPRPNGEYFISTMIPIRYTGRDNRFRTRVTHISYNQVLEMKHIGTSREQKPYRLFGDATPSQLNLAFGQSQDAIYKFEKAVKAPLLGQLPIDPELAKLCDEGEIERYNSDAFTAMAQTLIQILPQAISAKVS